MRVRLRLSSLDSKPQRDITKSTRKRNWQGMRGAAALSLFYLSYPMAESAQLMKNKVKQRRKRAERKSEKCSPLPLLLHRLPEAPENRGPR